MTAGLPGTGLGGFFYLICAILMPFHELCSRLSKRRREKKPRWGLVFKHTGIALGVLIGIWLTGWFLGHLIQNLIKQTITSGNMRVINIIRISTVSFALVNLLILIVMVQLASLTFKTKKK